MILSILIEDLGSGINLDRRGLNKIIHLAIEGKFEEVVVAYKNRLARFGFELIEGLINKYSNETIKIINQKQEPKEELIKNMLQIMNIFVAKMNGLIKHKNKNKLENYQEISSFMLLVATHLSFQLV